MNLIDFFGYSKSQRWHLFLPVYFSNFSKQDLHTTNSQLGQFKGSYAKVLHVLHSKSFLCSELHRLTYFTSYSNSIYVKENSSSIFYKNIFFSDS
jgi:hypothetical protein